MEFYMAPMEGLTGYIYRNAYHACFRPMDRYFTPFVSPRAQGGMKGGLSSREINDILPEHNRGLCVIPQILTNRAEDFLRAALILKEYGYREVNLNLGCPSPTVVSKNKGAGFLSMPHALDMFLETVTEELDKMGMEMSVKTRLGIYSSDEFYHLLEIYNKYPLTQLIIHSRVRTDYYKNTPDREMFGYGLERGSSPVCYNGDLFTAEDFRGLSQQYPKLGYVMMGRGIIANPGLVEAIETGTPLDKVRLEEFHQRIYEGYRGIMSGDRNVLFKMKEIWASMIRIFSDDGKYGKKIKKAQRLGEYEAAVSQVFRDLDIVEGAGFKLY
ncbi:tRNA dihydrouridine synthase [Enterocloster citroniae]|uniref:tRNA dihydrouridine synthase n=1 Tax=Enterocloster citroniae TaxID=358743 RepID=UPI00349ED904